MKKRILSLKLMLLISLSFLFHSCSQKDEKVSMLTKKWAYQEFSMNEQSMTGDKLGDPTMEFKEDGKYVVEFGPMSEEGTWRIEGDKLITESETHEQTNDLTIVELSEEKAVFYGDAKGNQVKITLVPYEEEETVLKE